MSIPYDIYVYTLPNFQTFVTRDFPRDAGCMITGNFFEEMHEPLEMTKYVGCSN